MMVLETERILLRTWEDSDIQLLADISEDDEVMEYFPEVQDIDATRVLVEKQMKCFEENGFCLFAVEEKLSGNFMGFIGLNVVGFDIPGREGDRVIEIGWRLGKEYWGKGYATEGARAVLEHAFYKLELDEIVSFTAVVNKRSIRVMEKIGLHVEASFDHPNLVQGHWLKEHVIYSLKKVELANG